MDIRARTQVFVLGLFVRFQVKSTSTHKIYLYLYFEKSTWYLYVYFRQIATQVEESDNGSDGIPGCGPTFGSLVLESDGILLSKFNGTYR